MKRTKKIATLVFITGLLVLCASCGQTNEASEYEKEVIDKLVMMSDVSIEDSSCTFTYCDDSDAGEGWEIIYSKSNEAVKIRENSIDERLSYIFYLGTDSVNNDNEFAYDFSEDEFRIYVDIEDDDGDISMISYNNSNDEILVMSDGEQYYAADWFDELFRESGIIECMNDATDNFFMQLDENGITKEDIGTIDFYGIYGYLA